MNRRNSSRVCPAIRSTSRPSPAASACHAVTGSTSPSTSGANVSGYTPLATRVGGRAELVATATEARPSGQPIPRPVVGLGRTCMPPARRPTAERTAAPRTAPHRRAAQRTGCPETRSTCPLDGHAPRRRWCGPEARRWSSTPPRPGRGGAGSPPDSGHAPPESLWRSQSVRCRDRRHPLPLIGGCCLLGLAS